MVLEQKEMAIVLKALAFAAHKHRDQRRKDVKISYFTKQLSKLGFVVTLDPVPTAAGGLFSRETDSAYGTATKMKMGAGCGRIAATAGLRSKRRWCCEPERETDPDTPEKHRLSP